MANFLILNTAKEASDRSKEILGKTPPEGDVTTLYFSTWGHPSDGRCALVVAGKEQAKLTAGEITALQTQAQMETAGWKFNPDTK